MKIKDLSVFTKVHVKGQKQIPKSVKTIHITVIQQIIMKLHWIQDCLHCLHFEC